MEKQFEEVVKKWTCKVLGIPYDGKSKLKDLVALLHQKFPKLEVIVCKGKDGYYIRRYIEREPTEAQLQSRLKFIEKYASSECIMWKSKVEALE